MIWLWKYFKRLFGITNEESLSTDLATLNENDSNGDENNDFLETGLFIGDCAIIFNLLVFFIIAIKIIMRLLSDSINRDNNNNNDYYYY